MNLKELLKLSQGKNFVEIKVIPNSSKTEFLGVMENNVLKFSAKGVPEKGKVNTEIIKYISLELGLKKNSITIISGSTGRNKLLRIDL